MKRIVKGKLGFNAPSLTVGGSGLYEEGEDADEDLAENLPKILSQCPAGGVVDGTEVTINDFTQDLEVLLYLLYPHAISFTLTLSPTFPLLICLQAVDRTI
jgi:hypothetical protein